MSTEQTETAETWRDSPAIDQHTHDEHGGCVAEENVRVPVIFLPDGRWHVATTAVDGYALDSAHGEVGPVVACGETDECGQVATLAMTVPLPSGPELAVGLLRTAVRRHHSLGFRDCTAIGALRDLLDLARTSPDSLLSRRVLALFGDEQEWIKAPLPPLPAQAGRHDFATTDEAYAASQSREDIRDGDLLVVAAEGVVGVMVSPWPIAVTQAHGAFHQLGDGADWADVREGRYISSAHRARALAAQLTAQQDSPADPGKISTAEQDKPDHTGPVTPGQMTPGMWIMVPDSSDPYGGRTIARQVAQAYSEEQSDSVGRWVIRFDGPYLHPASLVTAVDHSYDLADFHVTDRSKLITIYQDRDGIDVSNVPAPHLAAARIHVGTDWGLVLAVLELDPLHLPSRTWRIARDTAEVPTEWYAQRWTHAEPAIHWVWDETQRLAR